jgi:phosphoglycolate phosphatase
VPALDADAVLFDLDGVLIDSRASIASAINHALAAHGHPERGEDELAGHIGAGLHDVFAELSGSDDPDVADALVRTYRARYRVTSLTETAPMPGIAATLARLAARFPLVVATSKPRPYAKPILEAVGLAPYFRAICGPSLDVRNEPKATTVGEALEALPPATRAPVMVGDRFYDVEGAAAHGLPCVGVLWGIGSASELRGAGAVALAAAPEELAALLGA